MIETVTEGTTLVLQARVPTLTEDDFVEVGHLRQAERRLATTRLTLSFKGVGVSLIDDKPQELLYLSIHDIDLVYTSTSESRKIEFTIGRLQADNQTPSIPYPLCVYPTQDVCNQLT